MSAFEGCATCDSSTVGICADPKMASYSAIHHSVLRGFEVKEVLSGYSGTRWAYQVQGCVVMCVCSETYGRKFCSKFECDFGKLNLIPHPYVNVYIMHCDIIGLILS